MTGTGGAFTWQDGLDLAIRIGSRPRPDLIARKLGGIGGIGGIVCTVSADLPADGSPGYTGLRS